DHLKARGLRFLDLEVPGNALALGLDLSARLCGGKLDFTQFELAGASHRLERIQIPRLFERDFGDLARARTLEVERPRLGHPMKAVSALKQVKAQEQSSIPRGIDQAQAPLAMEGPPGCFAFSRCLVVQD